MTSTAATTPTPESAPQQTLPEIGYYALSRHPVDPAELALGLHDGLGDVVVVPHVAHDRQVHADHLVDAAGVDVDMDLDRAGREIGDPPRDAVVEAGAQVDHQVAAMHGHVGLVQAVHPQHPEP